MPPGGVGEDVELEAAHAPLQLHGQRRVGVVELRRIAERVGDVGHGARAERQPVEDRGVGRRLVAVVGADELQLVQPDRVVAGRLGGLALAGARARRRRCSAAVSRRPPHPSAPSPRRHPPFARVRHDPMSPPRLRGHSRPPRHRVSCSPAVQPMFVPTPGPGARCRSASGTMWHVRVRLARRTAVLRRDPRRLSSSTCDTTWTARSPTASQPRVTDSIPTCCRCGCPKGRLADLERCPRSAVARFRDDVARHAGRCGAARHGARPLRRAPAGRWSGPRAVVGAHLDAHGRAPTGRRSALLDEMDPSRTRPRSSIRSPPRSRTSGPASIPRWAPRTQCRAALVLADGACICSGVVDVELGGAATGLPGVVVEVKSGAVAAAHPHEVYLYALLVALRDGAAPAAVARWYPGADPVVLPVTLGVLESAAARLSAGAGLWAGADRPARPPPSVRAAGADGARTARSAPRRRPSGARPATGPAVDAPPDGDEGDDDGW